MHLAIIHFSPLEQYPPVMNWLRFLENKLTSADRVIVFTHSAPEEMQNFETVSQVISIKRYRRSIGGTALHRYKAYLGFYGSTIRDLARFKPDTVLYYESLSALPAMYYKYFLQKSSRLLVHYHEYTSPEEYRNSMLINYRAHMLEKRLYPRYSGISHTNSTRVELFRHDNPGISLPPQIIWPNYPPGAWRGPEKKKLAGDPVRFVYVGAFDLDTMYVSSFSRWILSQAGNATWDIFSWNCTPATRTFISEMKNDAIRFHEGVSYEDLPGILNRFDVGVILYKGHTANYIHNAPNKLFEYWSCGLDVWFPEQMTGGIPYISAGTYPRIIAVDFESPGQMSLTETRRTGLSYRPSPYTSESAAELYFRQMLN